MNQGQIEFLIVLAGTLGLFLWGRLRVDVVAVLTLLALATTGILDGGEALAGFSSEPAIIVAAVFVLSAGLVATGVTERIGAWIGKAAGASELRAVALVMVVVAALAAVSHHLMVSAMMLPILLQFSREKEIPPSRLLMPMSLAASLGTTLTLFSAPAFLLGDQMLEHAGGEGLGVFSITPIGIWLVILGTLYMLAGRFLIPRRGTAREAGDLAQFERFYTEILIAPGSPWVGKTRGDFEKTFGERLLVVDGLRHGIRRRGFPAESVLAEGDVLLVRAAPDELASIQEEKGLELHAVAKYGEASPAGGKPEALGEEQLVQAIVAPHSAFIGRSAAGIDFLRTLGVVVVGLRRRHGWIRGEIAEERLRAGDMLVLWGRQQTFSELATHHGFLMLMPFAARPRRRRRAPVALLVMGATVAAAATEILPAEIAFLAGAAAMVLTGCVGIEAAYRAVDVRIYVMIAGVIPLGIAMVKTGTADLFAGVLLSGAATWSPFVILTALFAAGACLTQILSDTATTVLLAPIALALAKGLNLPPEPFVVCTALGAVASFLTPIGHHGNLLIYGPGGYRFGDFLRVGIPLTLLIAVASAWLARWLWLGGPLLPGA